MSTPRRDSKHSGLLLAVSRCQQLMRVCLPLNSPRCRCQRLRARHSTTLVSTSRSTSKAGEQTSGVSRWRPIVNDSRRGDVFYRSHPSTSSFLSTSVGGQQTPESPAGGGPTATATGTLQSPGYPDDSYTSPRGGQQQTPGSPTDDYPVPTPTGGEPVSGQFFGTYSDGFPLPTPEGGEADLSGRGHSEDDKNHRKGGERHLGRGRQRSNGNGHSSQWRILANIADRCVPHSRRNKVVLNR